MKVDILLETSSTMRKKSLVPIQLNPIFIGPNSDHFIVLPCHSVSPLCQSCQTKPSSSLHNICQSCCMYLSVLTWTYRPLANPTKLKFDQEFDLFWSSNLIKALNVRVHCAFGTLFRVDMCNNRMSWGPVNSSLFCQWPPCWYCPYYPVARYQFEHQTQLNSNYRFCVGWYPKSPKN